MSEAIYNFAVQYQFYPLHFSYCKIGVGLQKLL